MVNVPAELDPRAELRLVAAFADVAPEALAALAELAVQRRIHAQLPLVEQGVIAQELLVLARGAAKVERRTPPEKGSAVMVLDVMRGPCLVSEPSIFDGLPTFASIVALRSSQVIAFPRRPLHGLILSHPTLARALLAHFSGTVRGHIRRMEAFVAGPVDERITRLLDDLAREHGTPLGQGHFIPIPLRRRDIASMVDATTETVSRLLAKFERDGAARSTRDGIWWRSNRAPAHPERDDAKAASSAAARRGG